MLEKAITFDCQGDLLFGIVHGNQGPERDVGILVVVGGPQYRVGSHRQFVLMARSFAASGYPVLRFDYRGMGDSSGEPRTFESVDEDIRAAVDTFCSEVPALRRIVVFGLCDAASAALMYVATDARVSGMILANPWVRTPAGEARAYVRHYYGQRLLTRSFWAKVFSGEFHVFDSVLGFLTSLRVARHGAAASSAAQSPGFVDRMLKGLEAFHGPVLILASERDLTAKEFMDLCSQSPAWQRVLARQDVHMEKLADADHTFSSRASLDVASALCLRWLSPLNVGVDGKCAVRANSSEQPDTSRSP